MYAWQSRGLLDRGSHFSPQVLPTLNGDSLLLSAKDKPLLIYFFAPWCPVCGLSISNVIGLDNSEFDIQLVALDYANLEEIKVFVDDHQIDLPVMLGHESLKRVFSVQGYPTYYILDKDNNVLMSDMGYSSTLGLKLRQGLASGF
ncbi:redoxin domain-containing protein [Alteromonadaceae bacterium BrNp21-10]|nr:redoxin domain-containing protein [Alteromonadaceae bacterium BrNp21-10]